MIALRIKRLPSNETGVGNSEWKKAKQNRGDRIIMDGFYLYMKLARYCAFMLAILAGLTL
jgi:hypothetical protein